MKLPQKLINARNEFESHLHRFMDDLQGQIDELEDKQSEHDSDARQEKIDALHEAHETCDNLLGAIEELTDEL